MITTEWPKGLSDLKSHIYLRHGVWSADIKDKDDATDCHRHCHMVTEIGHPIPHLHPGLSLSEPRGEHGVAPVAASTGGTP